MLTKGKYGDNCVQLKLKTSLPPTPTNHSKRPVFIMWISNRYWGNWLNLVILKYFCPTLKYFFCCARGDSPIVRRMFCEQKLWDVWGGGGHCPQFSSSLLLLQWRRCQGDDCISETGISVYYIQHVFRISCTILDQNILINRQPHKKSIYFFLFSDGDDNIMASWRLKKLVKILKNK